MTRSEVLGELDKCFGIEGKDVITRWCKLLILIESLYDRDRNDKDYDARIALSRFLLNILSFEAIKLEESPDIDNTLDAADYLGLYEYRYEVGISEKVVLLYFSDVTDRNVHLKLEELNGDKCLKRGNRNV